MYYKHPAQWTAFNWKVNHWSPNLNQSTSKNYFKPTIFNICDKFCNTGPITQCQKYLTRNFSFKAVFLHNLFLTLCNKANDPESRNKLHVYVQQNSSSSSYSIFTFILAYWHGWFPPPSLIFLDQTQDDTQWVISKKSEFRLGEFSEQPLKH